MAPFKCHLAFVLAMALVAVMPQPSTAVRAEPPTSSTAGVKPSKWLPKCWPFTPIFGPPTPVPPTPMKPYPKECLPSMMGLMPCKDFINSTATAPPKPSKCCDAVKSLFEDAPICICHLDNGEFDKLMPSPVDRENIYRALFNCDYDGPGEYGSCDAGVPPMRAAPTPEAAP
ncbi:unnamed protein product [Alopecurus aequalis]